MKEKNKNHYAIIMAGGVGSRFWPWSKKSMPKQFLDILGTGKTLLQITYERFTQILPEENILIITNEIYESLIVAQIPSIKKEQIIKEPLAMNTAPCIAYASSKIMSKNKNAVFVVAPSDHLILKETEFCEIVKESLAVASEKAILITIGITPNRPDTGYGYIQFKDDSKNSPLKKVKTFTEKPDLELAKTFLDSGDFLWNAGIFIWSGKSVVSAFEKYQPDMIQLFKEGNKFYNTVDEEVFIRKVYPTCKSISIDYAIMEKADNVFVIPADLGWSDLGTWKSLFETREKTEENNLIHGEKIMTMNTKNSLVLNQEKGKVVITNGVNNILVVNTDDALLICDLDKEQEVKMIVAELKNKFKDSFS